MTEWSKRSLNEACVILNGGTPKTKVKEYWGGDIQWLTPKDMGQVDEPRIKSTSRTITKLGLEKSSAKLIRENSVILSTRAPIGHLVINEVPMTTNQGCRGLVPSDELDVQFLYYFLLSNVDLLNSLGTGTTFKELSSRNLGSVEIPLPPLPEQKRIVAILDQAFEAIDQAQANIERNIKNAEELFQSKLNEVFGQSGEGWEEKSLGEIGKVSMCKRIFKDQTFSSGDIPFYKIGTFGKTPNAFISNDIYTEYRSKYSFPKTGDVLISASGTIGRRVRYDGEPAYFQDSNIVWIDNHEKEVSNDYLYFFYGICDWQPSKGATISRLYNSDLRRIKIRFPSLDKQQYLVKMFEELSFQIEEGGIKYEKKVEGLAELKKSLLQKAFSGELTEKEVVV